jgi:hypothetical protein
MSSESNAEKHGFDTVTGMKVKTSEGCLSIIVDSSEEQALRAELCRLSR